jgi:hypothetical protein
LLNDDGVKHMDYHVDANGRPIQTDQVRAELAATRRYRNSPNPAGSRVEFDGQSCTTPHIRIDRRSASTGE